LVTIVTPSYNQGKFIRATIESVLSQDYPQLEYIIMDGGSTDETASVVKDYASRLIFISEKDRGQSHAINKGFRMARGGIVAWLNSDDLFLPGAVRAAVDGFARNPCAGAVYGEGYRIDRDGNIIERFPHTEPMNLWKLIHLSDFILQQTVFFRKSVLDEVEYLDETLHYTMDWDLFIRIGLKYPVEMVPAYMGCLREYAEAKTSSGGVRRLQEIRSMLRRYTGKRYPPGFILYAAETYSRIWCERLEQLPGSKSIRIAGPLQSLIQAGAGLIAGHTLVYSQGLSSDGWVGRVLRYALPPGNRGLLIEGHIPYRKFRPLSQRFRIKANGRNLGTFSVPAGDFHLYVQLPPEFEREPLFLNLTSSFWRMPLRLRNRLAFRLRSLQGVPAKTENSSASGPQFAF
jgi:glycosyl transferase family 2